MLDSILSKENMTQAYHRVVSNGGASGIDGMKASELQSYLNETWAFLKAEILEGKYEPQAVRRVEIAKPNGGIRQLGIPTVLDRLLQQGIAQELQLLWESTFSDHSYGFRPKRNTHQAVRKAQSYVNAGRTYIVDIDLEKFFDRVNHDHLMHLLSARVTDKRVLMLIGKYLRAGVMLGGVTTRNEEGTPQGSPLSPLLSNIVLDVMDKELERRGHKFVRYADDFSIYCTSKRGAERIQSSITKFIEEELHLRINEEKSGIRRPSTMVLLGFGFHIQTKGAWGIRLAPKSITRLKEKIKQLTQRRAPRGTWDRIQSLKQVQQGWIHYFKIANCKKHLTEIDEWTRSRLRMCEWKLWKRVRTRVKRLNELQIAPEQAYQWANTRKGYWRTAHSPILTRSLNNEWFKSEGYVSLSELYAKYKERS
jgi:group II intron reverse transcriptase/maturase